MATTFPTAAFPAVPPASTPAIIAASRLAQMIGESSLVAAKIVAAKIVARQTVTAKLVTKKKITALKIFLHLPTPQPPASPPSFRGEN